MAKFVKNPSGTIHSVDDDFDLPGSEPDHEGWSVVSEAEAPAALLGTEQDPEVEWHKLREPGETVVDESGPAQAPGQLDDRESNDIQPAEAQQVEQPAAENDEETAK